MRRLHPDLKAALEETGLPYSVEAGGRHLHLRLCGQLVGILPRGKGPSDRRAVLNVRAQIRRAAKELA